MKPGDIVWADLDPTTGHEQRGHRPVLVVSERVIGKSMVVIVPLTSASPKAASHHPMRSNPGQTSTALTEHVRGIDIRRVTRFKERAHPDDLTAVRHLIARIMGLRPVG